jgi:hypothetical protein
MFYSRRINQETQKVEVWECEWRHPGAGMAMKEFVRKVGDEEDLEFTHDAYSAADAICWAPGRTIGNIAVKSDEVLGMFDGKMGDDAILPCQIIPCGRFRNGEKRWYCKTHQLHWGVKADYAAVPEDGEIRCGNHLMKMSYVVDPLEIEFNDYEEIGIWCSPAACDGKLPYRTPVAPHSRTQALRWQKEEVVGPRFCRNCLFVQSRPRSIPQYGDHEDPDYSTRRIRVC